MTSYIDSIGDPKSFRVCKRFNGNANPKGSDLRRSPWLIWDHCGLYTDKNNVVWLSLPQTALHTTVREAAIAVLTERGKFKTLTRVYTRGALTGNDKTLPIADLWDIIRVRLPDKGSKRDNHTLARQLGYHLTKFVESELCKYTEAKTDIYAGMTDRQKRRAIQQEKYERQKAANARRIKPITK